MSELRSSYRPPEGGDDGAIVILWSGCWEGENCRIFYELSSQAECGICILRQTTDPPSAPLTVGLTKYPFSALDPLPRSPAGQQSDCARAAHAGFRSARAGGPVAAPARRACEVQDDAPCKCLSSAGPSVRNR